MKMKPLAWLAAACLVSLAVPAFALTSTDDIAAVTGAGALIGGKVSLPWGAHVSAALQWAQPLAVTAVTVAVGFAGRALPAWGSSLIQEFVTQKRIERAVDYGITQVNGVVRGKTATLDAGNGVAAMAEQYMLKLVPQLASQLGDRLKPMILAQIGKVGVAPEAPIVARLPTAPLKQIRK